METIFINHELGYDYKIDEDGTGVFIYNHDEEKLHFKFSECHFYEGQADIDAKVVLQLSFTSTYFFYVLEKNGHLIGIQQELNEQDNYEDERIKVYDEHLQINKTGIASMVIYVYRDNMIELERSVNSLLSRKQLNKWINMELPIDKKKILGSVVLDDRAFFITYYPVKKALSLSKVFLEQVDSRIEDIAINNRSNVEISFQGKKYNFDFRKPEEEMGTIVHGDKKSIPEKIVLTLKINKRRYYIYSCHDQNYITSESKKAFGIKTNLKIKFINGNVFFYGKYNNRLKHFTGQFDYIYIKGKDKPIGKFSRPLAGFVNSFVFAKIPLKKLTDSEEMHRGLQLGNEYQTVYPLYMTNSLPEDFYVFKKKKIGRDVMFFRANVGNGTSCTILPFAEEYSFKATVKQKLARILEAMTVHSKTNLYFEKFSKKADESAIKVFDKVMSQKTKAKNYFILDKKSADFAKLKQKYGRHLVEKYSLRHYRLIYRADCFISTEFSNHVINDRIFINKLRSKITATPLIFLQHGIMFAKPIENPMAAGFRKKNVKINLKKIVVSSELEAEEFYKVGYNPEDLLLSGLATFDNPKVGKLTKYAYMPTYRYWEEYLVYENRLEETSYYRDIKNVIKAFQDNNLLDKLLIVPHNKFADYITEYFPDYKDIICTNPSEALTKSRIFITDYSSAIYDAINRGAYPIFWWKEKDLLIEKYRAEPSLNDETAPGPIAYDEQQLISDVLNAEKRNFELEPVYKWKYKQINQFSDNKNTDRIVNYLRSVSII